MSSQKLKNAKIGTTFKQKVIDRDGNERTVECFKIGDKKDKVSAEYMRGGSSAGNSEQPPE